MIIHIHVRDREVVVRDPWKEEMVKRGGDPKNPGRFSKQGGGGGGAKETPVETRLALAPRGPKATPTTANAQAWHAMLKGYGLPHTGTMGGAHSFGTSKVSVNITNPESQHSTWTAGMLGKGRPQKGTGKAELDRVLGEWGLKPQGTPQKPEAPAPAPQEPAPEKPPTKAPAITEVPEAPPELSTIAPINTYTFRRLLPSQQGKVIVDKAREVAKAMGYPPEFIDYVPSSRMGSEVYASASRAGIRFHDKARQDPKFVVPAMAHEIMHRKFVQVRNSGPDLDNYINNNMDALRKADGISAYSKEYWQKESYMPAQQSIPNSRTDTAIDETLAEISRLKRTGPYNPMGENPREIAPIWQGLYDLVEDKYQPGLRSI